MYEAFYKLSTKPFRLSPDPQFFYPSAGHKRALSYLLYGLNQAEGFVVITGAPGTGKTTLAHKLLSQIDTQSVVVAHLASTQIEAEDLLRLVAASFKLRSEHVSKAALLKDIESFLLARAREHKRCLLVVDEAQNLPSRSIEELRMLSNFQVGNKALMQVFLLGQQQFRGMLDSPEFEQLRQRVIADYHLQSLDAEESRRYIEARLQHAGWQNDPQFDAGAHARIFEYTGGLPRRINMFCDRLLLFGYLEGLHTLTEATVSSVIAELHNEILPRSSNVVFTPAERPVERVAAIEPRAPALAAVRTPAPPDIPQSPAVVTHAARPATHSTIAPQPATAPILVSQRPAKPAEPGLAKTARVPAALSVSTVTPVRDVPDSSMADFLLTPSPRKASAAGVTNERGLNTLDEPPRRLSSSAPSLAGTESRWLLMIISACVVLAVLAFWFFPSIHDAFQRMQPSESGSRAPHASDPAKLSTGLAQQITDPSENILTENRILVSPSSAVADHTIAAGSADESPRESNQSTVIPAPENKPAAVVVAGNPPARQASEPAANTAPQEQRSQVKTKPGVIPNQRVAALTPTAPVAKPAATAVLQGEPPPPGPTLAPTAPLDTDASINAISQRELALLVVKFTRYYEEGNLPLFLSLFDAQVRTEDSNTIEVIGTEYSDLFKKTNQRQILLGEIHWENTGRLAQGTGPFEVRISAAEGEPARSLKGDITFHLEKKDGRIVIIALYHTPR